MDQIIFDKKERAVSKEAVYVMEYLKKMAGKGVLAGQHTQTREQAELSYLLEITGKEPALCGFELLSYSPNIRYLDSSEECLKEVRDNQGTLENAFQWAERGGLVTFCWHWFSPLGGRDKSFYSKNTDFDAAKAVVKGTAEQEALLSDLDVMAGYLKQFQRLHIPILWRPFHEAEGNWFWWGAKGPEVAKQLYLLMFERFTGYHDMDHLIWVWNSPLLEGYPGDESVDIISRDVYPPAHKHTALEQEYYELRKLSDQKPTAIGENGTLPSVQEMKAKQIPWSWFMTWSNEFVRSENFTTKDMFQKVYTSDMIITLDKLEKLF